MGVIGIQDGAGAAAPKTWWIINLFEEIWAIYLYLFFLAQTSDNETTVYIFLFWWHRKFSGKSSPLPNEIQVGPYTYGHNPHLCVWI
jgi:hypothetical protein